MSYSDIIDCDSDSRWAAGQSIRPQSFVIIVGVQFIEPVFLWFGL